MAGGQLCAPRTPRVKRCSGGGHVLIVGSRRQRYLIAQNYSKFFGAPSYYKETFEPKKKNPLGTISKSGLKDRVPHQKSTLEGILNFSRNGPKVAGNWPEGGKLGLGCVLRKLRIPKSVGLGMFSVLMGVCRPKTEN